MLLGDIIGDVFCLFIQRINNICILRVKKKDFKLQSFFYRLICKLRC